MTEFLDFSEVDNVGEWLQTEVGREKNEEAKTVPTIIVSYRGGWWPYCLRYLEDLSSLYPKIKEFGGSVIMITSDKLEYVKKVAEGLEVSFDFAISDPSHKLTKFLRESDLPSPVITGKNGDEGYTTGNYLKYANSKGHKEGLLQPAVIVLNEEMKVIFEWKIEPKLSNVGGATDRPDLIPIIQLLEDKVNGTKEIFEIMNVEELSKVTKVKKFGVFDLRSISYAIFGIKKKKNKSKKKNKTKDK